MTIVISSIVAICAGLESFGGYGDIWREKRDICEVIKSEGFSFFQLTNDYSKNKNHKAAYPLFAAKVEELIRSEVKEYLAAAIQKRRRNSEGPGSADDGGLGSGA